MYRYKKNPGERKYSLTLTEEQVLHIEAALEYRIHYYVSMIKAAEDIKETLDHPEEYVKDLKQSRDYYRQLKAEFLSKTTKKDISNQNDE